MLYVKKILKVCKAYGNSNELWVILEKNQAAMNSGYKLKWIAGKAEINYG